MSAAVATPPTGAAQHAPTATFRIHGLPESELLRKDPYTAALAFVRGEFDVEGDLAAAIRYFSAHCRPSFRGRLAGTAARLLNSRLAAWVRTHGADSRDVSFHYDRSNAFYQQFLDANMVYSCACFPTPRHSLEAAQLAKLDHICRKLRLRPEERLLDIGCGWGALLIRAAQCYGVRATGCTLCSRQVELGQERIREAGLESRARIRQADYRDMTGTFDKIASVGMFEHVGRSRLGEYFATVYDLLAPDGLFLNHGIVRRGGVEPSAETLFLQRHVFPGSGLAHLAEVIDEAERAGFEVIDVENLRPHYALTCRAWVDRLRANAAECRKLVDEATYRTWLLYLAGSAINFEDGYADVHQMLLCRRGCVARPLTRDYMYRD